MKKSVSLQDIESAAKRISGFIHRTDVLTSSFMNGVSGKELFFKSEMMQKTGSFKARGALNGIKSCLERDGKVGRIVTHSSGNHGQAVAWASQQCNLPCTVVVPEGTPRVKCEAIKGYGAELVFCTPTPTGRKETADRIAKETGGVIIHPYDNYDVMAGQGTIGLELLQQVPDLDVILVPISGGGMTSGIATAAKSMRPTCKVIAVEPLGKNLKPCLESKERLWSNPPQFLDTIAEGIKTQQVGQLTFPILCDLVDDVLTVTDQQMADGCKLVAERMKIVVEASSGASVAAALDQKIKELPGSKIGVILCGGNVDMDNLPWMDTKLKI